MSVRLLAFVIIPFLLAGFFSSIAFAQLSATACPKTGERPATASDAIVKSGRIPVGTCINPNDIGVSNSASEAKEYLLSIAEGLSGTQAPPNRDRVFMLNDTFAICAANFIKNYTRTTGVAIKLRSAVRCGPNSPSSWSCDRTENARAGGATGSNHQTGLAIDINPADGNYPRLWKAANSDPSQGVCFPYLNGDRPHLALAGTGTGESARCVLQGVTKACSGAPAFNPNAQPYVAGTGSGNVPTGGTNQTGGMLAPVSSNPFANPYNPTQQSMPTSYSSYPTPTPYPTDTTSYNSPTPVSVPAPTTGVATMPPLYVPPSNTSIQTGAPQTTSDYDKLKQLASTSQSTGTSVSTGTSLNGSASSTRLNGDLYDIDYGGSHTGGANIEVGTLAVMATSSVAINPVHVTQTFSGTNAPPQTAGTDVRTAQNQSLVVALLTTLRDLLVSYLKFLQTRTTYGFQGAWQPAQSGTVYR